MGLFQTLTLDDNVATMGYQVLLHTISARVRPRMGYDIDGVRLLIAVVEGTDNGILYGNDTLVTTRSGLGTGSWSTRTTSNALLTGSVGRNHANVANSPMANIVGPWVVATERQKGDLK